MYKKSLFAMGKRGFVPYNKVSSISSPVRRMSKHSRGSGMCRTMSGFPLGSVFRPQRETGFEEMFNSLSLRQVPKQSRRVKKSGLKFTR